VCGLECDGSTGAYDADPLLRLILFLFFYFFFFSFFFYFFFYFFFLASRAFFSQQNANRDNGQRQQAQKKAKRAKRAFWPKCFSRGLFRCTGAQVGNGLATHCAPLIVSRFRDFARNRPDPLVRRVIGIKLF
jgi:hypothetical protein